MMAKEVCEHSDDTDPLHACPFASEIHSNYDDEYCRCCVTCQHECAMDI